MLFLSDLYCGHQMAIQMSCLNFLELSCLVVFTISKYFCIIIFIIQYITTLYCLASCNYSPFSLLTAIKPEELEGGLTTPMAFLAITLNS